MGPQTRTGGNGVILGKFLQFYPINKLEWKKVQVHLRGGTGCSCLVHSCSLLPDPSGNFKGLKRIQWFGHGRLIPCTNVKDNHQIDFGHLAFNMSAAPCLQPSLSDRRPLSKWAKHSRGIPERNKQQSMVRIVPMQLPVTANKEEVFLRKFFKVILGIWQIKWDVSQSYTWNLFSCNGHLKVMLLYKGEERMTYLGLFICILVLGKISINFIFPSISSLETEYSSFCLSQNPGNWHCWSFSTIAWEVLQGVYS